MVGDDFVPVDTRQDARMTELDLQKDKTGCLPKNGLALKTAQIPLAMFDRLLASLRHELRCFFGRILVLPFLGELFRHQPFMVGVVVKFPDLFRPRHHVEVKQVIAMRGTHRMIAFWHQNHVAILYEDGLV